MLGLAMGHLRSGVLHDRDEAAPQLVDALGLTKLNGLMRDQGVAYPQGRGASHNKLRRSFLIDSP